MMEDYEPTKVHNIDKMKILIACEESQEVCKAFRKLGHEAYSCDILECSGGHPEWHIKGDVLDYIDNNPWNNNEGWDLMIAFPPCTHLAVSGARWFKNKKKEQEEAIRFVMDLYFSPIPRVAIENPISVLSTKWEKPNQIIQPFQFGNPSRKATCLWLRGLPLLKPTKIVEPKLKKYKDGSTFSADYGWSSNKNRGKTFPGIAKAMAKQWGGLNAPLQSA